jgi:hypothetical protein
MQLLPAGGMAIKKNKCLKKKIMNKQKKKKRNVMRKKRRVPLRWEKL